VGAEGLYPELNKYLFREFVVGCTSFILKQYLYTENNNSQLFKRPVID